MLSRIAEPSDTQPSADAQAQAAALLIGFRAFMQSQVHAERRQDGARTTRMLFSRALQQVTKRLSEVTRLRGCILNVAGTSEPGRHWSARSQAMCRHPFGPKSHLDPLLPGLW